MNASEMNLPYPAQTKQAAGQVDGIPTDVMVITFSDKIMVTVTQAGRLAQWVNIHLQNDNPTDPDSHLISDRSNDDSLLPSSRFTPRTLLGAGGPNRETIGHLYASQIASAITTKNPTESRSLALGLGLAKVDTSRDIFLEIIELVLKCL